MTRDLKPHPLHPNVISRLIDAVSSSDVANFIQLVRDNKIAVEDLQSLRTQENKSFLHILAASAYHTPHDRYLNMLRHLLHDVRIDPRITDKNKLSFLDYIIRSEMLHRNRLLPYVLDGVESGKVISILAESFKVITGINNYNCNLVANFFVSAVREIFFPAPGDTQTDIATKVLNIFAHFLYSENLLPVHAADYAELQKEHQEIQQILRHIVTLNCFITARELNRVNEIAAEKFEPGRREKEEQQQANYERFAVEEYEVPPQLSPTQDKLLEDDQLYSGETPYIAAVRNKHDEEAFLLALEIVQKQLSFPLLSKKETALDFRKAHAIMQRKINNNPLPLADDAELVEVFKDAHKNQFVIKTLLDLGLTRYFSEEVLLDYANSQKNHDLLELFEEEFQNHSAKKAAAIIKQLEKNDHRGLDLALRETQGHSATSFALIYNLIIQGLKPEVIGSKPEKSDSMLENFVAHIIQEQELMPNLAAKPAKYHAAKSRLFYDEAFKTVLFGELEPQDAVVLRGYKAGMREGRK